MIVYIAATKRLWKNDLNKVGSFKYATKFDSPTKAPSAFCMLFDINANSGKIMKHKNKIKEAMTRIRPTLSDLSLAERVKA